MQDSLLELALESLSRAGELRLKVNGTSMIPAVFPGSYALIRRAALGEVTAGRIVLVRTETGVRLHRFIRRVSGSGMLVTRGDNHSFDDPPVSPDQMLGVLVSIEERPPLSLRMWARCRIRLASWRRQFLVPA